MFTVEVVSRLTAWNEVIAEQGCTEMRVKTANPEHEPEHPES
jgi:hypothetical protein